LWRGARPWHVALAGLLDEQLEVEDDAEVDLVGHDQVDQLGQEPAFGRGQDAAVLARRPAVVRREPG
jgi:hypothetical protein